MSTLMAATDLLPSVHTIATAVGALVVFSSLTTLLLVISTRMLDQPPPGHTPVGWFERVVAAWFVCFLAIGPLWLVAIITSGGNCT